MKNPISRRRFIGYSTGAAGSLLLGGSAACSSPDGGSIDYIKRIPADQSVDVAVCGGGASGVTAALATAREGLKTLIIETQGQLGGNGTSGHVSHWLGGRMRDCERWAVGGLFREMTLDAVKSGFALLPKDDPGGKPSPHGWFREVLTAGIPFDPFAMAQYLDSRVEKAGTDILFNTQAVDAIVEEDRITHIVISNKSGLSAVPVKAVIDATGDADIAFRSGCETVSGRPEDGLMAPATLMFHVYGVDQDTLAGYISEHKTPRFREKIKQLRTAGEWPFPYDIFISVQLQEKGVMMINTSRLVGIDGTDGKSVTQGFITGRKETQQLIKIMRKNFPGFANAEIKTVAPNVGIRETRRIQGDFILKVADMNAGRPFTDTIGYTAYVWDLPDPKRPSVNPTHGESKEVSPIPYRVMVPKPVRNLICPGRVISVEQPVLGPMRVMAPCMAMGEAAGAAAALAVRNGSAFSEVNTDELRAQLKNNGAIVDSPA